MDIACFPCCEELMAGSMVVEYRWAEGPEERYGEITAEFARPT